MENIELKLIENAMNFSNLLKTENRENFQNLLKFLVDFREIYDKEKADLPYHINLIDELHADENAHSRIFAKLLRYKEKDKFPFLENFLNNVCDFDLSIEKPEVKKVDSCGRIDIPIFDKKYVVVIENKVTDKAPDQNGVKGGQLARYIETIKDNYKRDIEEIFVIYTPKYTREPSDACWNNKDGFSYKDGFKFRFRSLSYRDCIYPWFKYKIRDTVNTKDIYLSSAIEQYIDHLEGIFSLRTIDKKMNMKLQEFIKTELKLQDDNLKVSIDILTEKEEELNNAISQIQLLKNNYTKQYVLCQFEKWGEELRKEFPNRVIGDKFIEKPDIVNIGVKLTIEDKSFAVMIECNNVNQPNIYIGIGTHFVSDIKFDMPEFFNKIFQDAGFNVTTDEFFYGWKYSTVENSYDMLINLIRKIETYK
jgi:hypothetical protein